jgi:outer membrane receptor for ferrienterochelin and colicin
LVRSTFLPFVAACLLSHAIARAEEPGATATPAESATPVPASSPAPSVAGAKPYDDMSLEELLEVPIAVAGRNARPIREVPGVITLITRTQIEASGARDLMDVLRQVPGFEFALDLEGVVSMGFRGNWLEEGKALLLVDGEDFADLLYLSLPLGKIGRAHV